jgi:hypothetical protein
MPTVDGNSPFLYFDGATMNEHKYPPKNVEVAWCRRVPSPDGCDNAGHGFDQERQNIPITALAVVEQQQQQQQDSNEKSTDESTVPALSLVSTSDIPLASYVGLEKMVHPVAMELGAYKIVNQMGRRNPVSALVRKYGSSSSCCHVSAIFVVSLTQTTQCDT